MIICKHANEYRIIYESVCLRDLYNELEELAWDYVNKLQVIPRIFYRKSTSHKWGKVPLGYFLVAGPNKVTVYNKLFRYGILYNSTIIEKKISFILIKPKKITIAEMPDDYEEYRPIEELHKELLGHFEVPGE